MVTLAAAASAYLAGPAVAGEAELYAAAKKEGEVVFYTGLLQNQLVRPMAAAFEAKYPGIKVTIVGGGANDLTLKVLEEAKAGVFNVDVLTPARIDGLDQAGLIERYQPEAAKNYPAHLKNPDGKWTALMVYFYGLSVNTELVSEAETPKSIEDYLDPKWKGKIAWVAALGGGGPPVYVAAILQRLGEDKGRAYLKKLAQQNMVKVPSNQRVVMDQVIAGQYPLALMTFHHHAYISQQKKAPVKWVAIDPVTSAIDSVLILKKAPHPNAAKLFTEFALSVDGAKIVSDALYVPAHPDVKPIVPLVPVTSTGQPPITFSQDTQDANMDQWIKIYQEIFG